MTPSRKRESASKPDLRLNILVAYPYCTPRVIDFIKEHQDAVRFIVDSGAFTAWKGGKPVQMDDYCRFLEGLRVEPWHYFALDEIGDAEKTYTNFLEMRRRGFKPVPIFTRGERPERLEDYYGHSKLVAVGGLVGTFRARGFLNGIMKRINGRQVHWFGFADTQYLKTYRPFSCDTSVFESGARYGRLRLYMGSGRFSETNRPMFAKKPPIEIMRRVEQLGFDPGLLAKEGSWRRGHSVVRRLCAASAVAYMLDVQKNLGTYLFAAYAANEFGMQLVEAYRRQMP